MNRMRVLAVGLLVLGMALFVSSIVWSWLLPTEFVWTREQGIEQAKASTQLHKLTHDAAHMEVSNRSESEKEEARKRLAESKQRFEKSRAALEKAQTLRQRIPFVLRWAGVATLVVGIGIHLSIRNAPESSVRSNRSRSALR